MPLKCLATPSYGRDEGSVEILGALVRARTLRHSMMTRLQRALTLFGSTAAILLSGCGDSSLAPATDATPGQISFSVRGAPIGAFQVGSATDPCIDPPPPPNMMRARPGESGFSIQASSTSCDSGAYTPRWAPMTAGLGGSGCNGELPGTQPIPLGGSFVWRVACTPSLMPPADWAEHGFREPTGLSSWAPIVRTGSAPATIGGGTTEDQELVDLAMEPLTPEEADECPDCVVDAIALATDLIDIGCNGLTFSRGVAAVSDALGLLIPGLPSAGGVRIARRALFNRARDVGLAQHRAYALAKKAQGWISQRGLPMKSLRPGQAPTRLFPDAIRVDPATNTVLVRELKPASRSGEAAGRVQAEQYREVLRQVQVNDNGILRINNNDGQLQTYDISGYDIDVRVEYYEPPSFICSLGPDQ